MPVSSSAHLVIVPKLLNWSNLLHQNPTQLSFDIILHLGSLMAILTYFRKDLISLATERTPANNKLLKFLVIGTIPAAVIGLLFNDFFEELFGSVQKTAVLLIFTGIIILTAELTAKLTRDLPALKTKDSLVIGFAQAAAIAPGISRSGSTISAGLLLGLNREAAARFSFLLAIPAVFGAFIFSIKEAQANMFNFTFLAGLISSFIFSYLAIKFLLGYLQRGSLKVFGAYCLVAGAILVVL